MAIGVPGGAFDLYREHITNNAATYAPTGNAVQTDDYYLNAVNPLVPTRNTATRNNAYGTQQTTTDWWAQTGQNRTQT